MLCTYIALVVAGYSVWLSLLGAIAVALSTIHFGNMDAGHSTKIMALSVAVPTLVGLYLLFKKKYLKGFLLMAFFGAILISANHLQITYYTFLLGVIIAMIGSLLLVRSGQTNVLVKVAAIAFFAAVVSVLPNTSMLWSNYDYSKDSVRGKRILAGSDQHSEGLSQDYASVFSHDLLEIGSLFIPRLVGGGDKEMLGTSSATYQEIERTGLLRNRIQGSKVMVPLFWGDKPLNEAPTYVGIVLFTLYLLSLFFVERSFRIMSLTLVIFCCIIAMGSHLRFINTLMFDYLPFFNKFRAPSMVLGLVTGVMAWTVVHGLTNFIHSPSKLDSKRKHIVRAVGLLGVVCLFFATIGPSFFDFSWDYGKEKYGVGIDENFENQLLNAGNPLDVVEGLMAAIIEDRASAMRSDSFRSLFFLALVILIVFGFYKKRINETVLVGAFICLLAIDLITVGHRYLNDQDFVEERLANQQLQPSNSDVSISKLKMPYDRVLDMTGSVWINARPSYFHANVGGNHAAKLRRYQDLIDYHLNGEVEQIKSGSKKGAVPALNMLNTRFIKTGHGAKDYLQNVTALGFAWFVDSVAWADTQDEEIQLIGSLDRSKFAIVNREFQDQLATVSFDSSQFSMIELRFKEPGKVVYKVATDQTRLLVFSEVLYKPNEYWKSYIDDKEVEHLRANYMLRALVIPQGAHEIKFEYKAKPFVEGEPIAAGGSVVWLLSILGCGMLMFRRGNQSSAETSK
jgi:hypothetical protein